MCFILLFISWLKDRVHGLAFLRPACCQPLDSCFLPTIIFSAILIILEKMNRNASSFQEVKLNEET